MHPVHAKAALDDVNRCGLGSGQITGFKLDVNEDVVPPFLVDIRLSFLQGVRHRDDRLQRLEFHLDKRRDVFRLGWRRSDHQRDRLADVPDLPLGQDRPVGRLEPGHFSCGAKPAETDEIVGEID